MSGTPHALSESAAKRVVNATKWVEGQRQHGPARRTGFPRPQPAVAGTAFEFVAVRERDFESTATTILVTPVVRNEGEWVFQSGPKGNPIVKRIWAHPKYEARHYAGFGQPVMGESDQLGAGTQVLKAFKVGGTWYLEQTVKWNMPFQEDRFAIEGYLPRRQ